MQNEKVTRKKELEMERKERLKKRLNVWIFITVIIAILGFAAMCLCLYFIKEKSSAEIMEKICAPLISLIFMTVIWSSAMTTHTALAWRENNVEYDIKNLSKEIETGCKEEDLHDFALGFFESYLGWEIETDPFNKGKWCIVINRKEITRHKKVSDYMKEWEDATAGTPYEKVKLYTR